eukprot:365216-Chlamydomonas_euryale.AAC.11
MLRRLSVRSLTLADSRAACSTQRPTRLFCIASFRPHPSHVELHPRACNSARAARHAAVHRAGGGRGR